MERYLRPTEVIDCDTESIRNRALLMTEGLETDRERAVSLFYFVRDEVRNNPFAPGDDLRHYRASATLERGDGQCQQKAVLLVALTRAMGIPARLGFTDIRDHLLSDRLREVMGGTNLLSYHGHSELCIDGKWLHASPAYDAKMCREKRFVPVDFDGISDARDPPYDQDGRPHIEYVRLHGHYDDFPWDEILRAVLETYG
jgi:transglutaminase-like putative cysteine protease